MLEKQLIRLEGEVARLKIAVVQSTALAKKAGMIARLRRSRERFFTDADDLFGEPAWDLLLDLYAAQAAGMQVSVSSACIAAAVPQTTALRWLKAIEKKAMIVRLRDPFDGRRQFVRLTDAATGMIEAWLKSF